MLSVFGSTGFIGSNYCKKFFNKIIEIERDDREPKSKDILYFISTVDNYNVFNNITLDVETNLKVLCEVLENCKNQEIVFNFVSSWFVYGNTYLPAKEDSICDPKGFYSITKRAAEQLLISFCETYGVKYRILRLCNVYGVDDKKVSKKKNAIQYMINLLKEDKDVFLYDEGKPVRDLLYIDDVCRAIEIVLEKGEVNQIYNIGSGVPIKIKSIIELSKQILNSKSEIKFIDSPFFHKIVQSKDFWMDTTKLKSLGFQQKTSLMEGLHILCGI